MKLPSLPFLKKGEEKKYVLALLLQDEVIRAVIFEETSGSIRIATQAQATLTSLLEQTPFEDLLDAVDRAVTSAESALPHGLQTTQTVFGVKAGWIEEGKIKKEHLAELKKICDELSLTPIGFLVFTEAILHLLHKEEGAPVSGILVETGKQHITVSLVRAGRIISVKQVSLEASLPDTVDTALKQFSDVEILPARIILFDGKENNKTTQSFISHSWSKTLPFLHVPQVTILPPNFDTKAVLFGTATQMNLEVGTTDIPELVENKEPQRMHAEPKGISEEKTVENERPTMTEEELPTSAETPEEENLSHTESKEESAHTVDAEYFGFVQNKDITQTTPTLHVAKEVEQVPDEVIGQTIEEIPDSVKEEITRDESPESFSTESNLLFKGVTSNIENYIKHIPLKQFSMQSLLGVFKKKRKPKPYIEPAAAMPEEHTRRTTKPRSKLFIVPVGLLVIIGIIVAYVMLVSATVTINITPKVIQNQQSVTFVPNGTTDTTKNTIGTTSVSVDEQDNASANATGTKDVGTSAKGTITIFNADSNPASISAKEVVSSSNGLKFTIDNAVNVPPSNGDPTDPQSGKATANVTASDIGTSYNLPSGTKFTFADSSLIAAKNDNAFSGGTKNTLTVVSQKDVDNLLSSLTKNLEQKAKSDLQNKLDGSKVLLSSFTSEDVTKKTLSNQVGDQAKTISINATITYTGQAYSKQDVLSLAQGDLKNQASSDLNISSDGIQTNVQDIKQNDDQTMSATLTMKASLLPTIDTNQFAKNIAGKSFDQVVALIKNIPQSNDTTIVLKPSLPFLPKVLPRLPQHIHIVIISNE